MPSGSLLFVTTPTTSWFDQAAFCAVCSRSANAFPLRPETTNDVV
jgi:hypothetical protein